VCQHAAGGASADDEKIASLGRHSTPSPLLNTSTPAASGPGRHLGVKCRSRTTKANLGRMDANRGALVSAVIAGLDPRLSGLDLVDMAQGVDSSVFRAFANVRDTEGTRAMRHHNTVIHS